MSFNKLYDLAIRIFADAGNFIDRLIDGTSPWPPRYRWLANRVTTAWKSYHKLPTLGRTPTATLTVVCLLTIFFYLAGVYGVLNGIRIPLLAQQPNVPLYKILIASIITGLCIGFSFKEGRRLMKHAGRLWQRAPLVAKAQTIALLMFASAGSAAMPLLPLVS